MNSEVEDGFLPAIDAAGAAPEPASPGGCRRSLAEGFLNSPASVYRAVSIVWVLRAL